MKIEHGGNFPMTYVFPAELRPYRDLLRRRNFLVRRRSKALAYIQLTNYQYNLPPFEKQISKKGNRSDLGVRFKDLTVRKNVDIDLDVADHTHKLGRAIYYMWKRNDAFDESYFFKS